MPISSFPNKLRCCLTCMIPTFLLPIFHLILQQEQLTPHVASTIDSYMKEHSVSIEVAREKIHTLKEESWNDFNSEWLNPNNTYPKQALERIFNLTRTMEFMYNQEDNFTNCPNLKDTIYLLFAEPFAN